MNFPINPAVRGIPARESIATVSVKAINGLVRASPLKLSKLSDPVWRFTKINTANAIIEATE